MPIRGESVGTAYVRIIADATDLPDSIREELREADADFKESGSRNAKSYQQGFEDQIERRGSFMKAQKAFLRGMGRMDAVGSQHGSDYLEGIRKKFESRFGQDVGRRLGDRLEKSIREGMDLSVIDEFLEDLGIHFNAVTNDIIEEQNRLEKENEDFEANFRKTMDSIDRDTKRATASISAEFDKVNRSIGNLRRPLLGLADQFERDFAASAREVEIAGERHHTVFGRIAQDIDLIGDKQGRIFGRGARNDFVNFFGSMVRAGSRVVSIIPKILSKFEDFGRGVFDAFREASLESDGFFGTIRGGFTNLGKQLGGFAKSGPAAIALIAGALANLALVLGPIAALISTLAAGITALVSSIAFAVVGTLAPLVGLITPVAVGLATVAGAILTMNDEMKDALKEAVQPLVDEFTKLGEIAGEEMFANIVDQAKALSDEFRGLRPLARGVGEAFRNVVDNVVAGLQSRAFDRFVADMTEFIPGALESLGNSIANTFGGLAGVFRALIPATEEFLGWLEEITGHFVEWANSREGQRELIQFFEDAAESAKTVWEFLGQVGEALAELFNQGRDEGDDLFTSMTETLRDFIRFLEENPDTLNKWFEDGKEVLQTLGEIVLKIGEIIDTLDTPENRALLKDFLDSIVFFGTALITVFEGVATFVSYVRQTLQALGDAFRKVRDWVSDLRSPLLRIDGIVSRLAEPVQEFYQTSRRAFSALGDRIGDAVSDLRGKFSNAWDAVDRKISEWANGARAKLRDVRERITDAASWLRSRFNEATNAVQRFFNELGSDIRGKFNDIRGHVSDAASNLRSRFNEAVNSVQGFFSNLGSTIRSRMSDARSAVSGFASDMRERFRSAVNDAVEFFTSVPSRIRDRLSGLDDIVRGALDDAVQAAEEIVQDIIDAFTGLGGKIADAIGSINLPMPNIPDVPGVPGIARGAITAGPTFAMIGEAGKEAVVPLELPIHQVDPSVRWMAELIRGETPKRLREGGVEGGGKNIEVGGITIVTPTKDPVAVATETINQLAVTGYF